MWLGKAKYWFSCRKMYIFDSASGDRPKGVGWMVRRPGEGLLLIGNSDLLTTCGAANAGPLSPTRLAPHSWRADPWSSNRVSPALEKDRGFVNGAIGIVEIVLCDTPHTCVFTVRLTSGSMVVVHPHSNWRPVYLPCAYGYATTIRRAQGSSLDQECLFFDHSHPPVGATKRKLMQWKQIY